MVDNSVNVPEYQKGDYATFKIVFRAEEKPEDISGFFLHVTDVIAKIPVLTTGIRQGPEQNTYEADLKGFVTGLSEMGVYELRYLQGEYPTGRVPFDQVPPLRIKIVDPLVSRPAERSVNPVVLQADYS
jgi:hypothetical protein